MQEELNFLVMDDPWYGVPGGSELDLPAECWGSALGAADFSRAR